ncbi:MAG TPA: encapsulin [Amycolatopsis sp.]|nr:encapsulin [Amycolatopsis sp.]
MNNLHRELAPISESAWTDLQVEARRTFALFASARRVLDVHDPA